MGAGSGEGDLNIAINPFLEHSIQVLPTSN